MIFLGTARQGGAGRGWAPQGNTSPGTATRTIFRVRQVWAWSGAAWSGRARRGLARLGNNACRWAVSPDTFGKQKQGNQSKTT